MLTQLKLIFELLPIVIQAIRSVEALFPESGKGPIKKALITGIAETVESIYGATSEIIPVLEKMIPVIVNVFNRFGVFSTSNSSATK